MVPLWVWIFFALAVLVLVGRLVVPWSRFRRRPAPAPTPTPTPTEQPEDPEVRRDRQLREGIWEKEDMLLLPPSVRKSKANRLARLAEKAEQAELVLRSLRLNRAIDAEEKRLAAEVAKAETNIFGAPLTELVPTTGGRVPAEGGDKGGGDKGGGDKGGGDKGGGDKGGGGQQGGPPKGPKDGDGLIICPKHGVKWDPKGVPCGCNTCIREAEAKAKAGAAPLTTPTAEPVVAGGAPPAASATLVGTVLTTEQKQALLQAGLTEAEIDQLWKDGKSYTEALVFANDRAAKGGSAASGSKRT